MCHWLHVCCEIVTQSRKKVELLASAVLNSVRQLILVVVVGTAVTYTWLSSFLKIVGVDAAKFSAAIIKGTGKTA